MNNKAPEYVASSLYNVLCPMYLRAVLRHPITDDVKLKFPQSALVCKKIRTQVHKCNHDSCVKNERKMTPLNQSI